MGQLTHFRTHTGAVAVDRLLADGRSALKAGRWEEARTAFTAALAHGEPPAALQGLGEVLWWLGEPQASLAYHRRAYVAYQRLGDVTGAGRSAISVMDRYASNFGNAAAAAGWLARAERLIADIDHHPLRRWLSLIRIHHSPESALAIEPIERLQSLARAAGNVDLELAALAELGGRLVQAGRVDEGLGLLDEAMTGSFAGECQSFFTPVWASCEMLKACEIAGDLRRATEWVRVVDEFTDHYGCPFVYASCRMRYGSLLVAKGQWPQAEQELRAALRLSGGAGPRLETEALARFADLRLRQGRLEDAEALMSGVHDELAAGLTIARVRCARGESVVALLERYEAQSAHQVGRAAGLAMLVDAYLAELQLGPANSAAKQLDALAQAGRGGTTGALAALAAARVATAEGELDRALFELTRALDLFARLDMPLETAQTRLELARAQASDSRHAAVAEARRALTMFDELGATTDADTAAALLRSLGATGRSRPRRVAALTKREEEVLHLIGLGLTNPEIAQRLYISRKTAAHHVSNVLVKLGLRNRSEAAAYTHPAPTAPT
jgi:DNA-binding CsgD family transcriptional regulator/predicted negative regulator of RcsB-dependent stress response